MVFLRSNSKFFVKNFQKITTLSDTKPESIVQIMKIKLLIFLMTSICLCMDLITCANILVLMPLFAYSHLKTFQPLFEELIKRGYNLTIVSGFPLSNGFKSNYTFINVEKHFHFKKIIDMDLAEQRINNFQHLVSSFRVGHDYSEEVLQSSEIQRLIHSSDQYDLIMAELFFTDAFLAFGYKFHAPIVALSSQTLLSFYNWMLGQPLASSHVPNSLLSLTGKMSLMSRAINLGFNFISILYYEFISLPRTQIQIEKYFHFNEGNVPQIKDVVKNLSVVLINGHYSFGYTKTQSLNMVNVAGIHFTSLKPMPMSIQKFMDEAENGVIYVSFGTLINPRQIENFGKILIQLLKNLPQRILMKWDKKLLPNIPENVQVREWIPQAAVLNHPNCRLFVTHGGLLSSLESLNASVPLLGIPFFGDQYYNMGMVEYFKIGKMLHVEDVSTEFSSTINELLRNPKYKLNIKKRSILFQERLTSPLDTAVFWVEHVIKYGDGGHLRAVSSQLTWYQLYSLDVFAVFLTFILAIKFTLKIILPRIIFKDRKNKNFIRPSKKIK